MASGWRLARSLDTLRNQVNATYPNRSKASDGTIGDVSHSQRASDHNPNRNGVVCAIDLTHDPSSGFDAHALAEHLRKNRHPNLRYIISNERIAGWWTNWEWQKGTGHTKHVHFSVGTLGVSDGQTYDRYDDTKSWDINYKGEDMPIPDSDNYYNRYNKAMQYIRGRGMSREEFSKNFVGNTDLNMLEKMLDSQEADEFTSDGNLGKTARINNWQQQIYDLQEKLKQKPNEVIKEVPVEKVVYQDKIVEVVKGDDERSLGDLLSAAFRKLFKIK